MELNKQDSKKLIKKMLVNEKRKQPSKIEKDFIRIIRDGNETILTCCCEREFYKK